MCKMYCVFEKLCYTIINRASPRLDTFVAADHGEDFLLGAKNGDIHTLIL